MVFFFLSQIYGLFPSVYGSRYPRQVSEDDRSCRFPNSDEPDVFTAFRVKMVDLTGWGNSRAEGRVAPDFTDILGVLLQAEQVTGPV